jgi:hypothetical protein
VRCGIQNKMDDTKRHDTRKHIPWRYALNTCVLFLSHLLCHLIYLRSVSCTQYCSVSLYCPCLNDPLVFLNVYLYWFQFFVQMRMTDTSVVRVILIVYFIFRYVCVASFSFHISSIKGIMYGCIYVFHTYRYIFLLKIKCRSINASFDLLIYWFIDLLIWRDDEETTAWFVTCHRVCN